MKHNPWLLVVLALIGGSTLIYRYGERQQLIDHLLSSKACAGCDLRGANLSGLDLNGVNLKAAKLAGANLQGARLGNAILTQADLTRADLTGADLGCTIVDFDLRADRHNARLNLTVDPASPAAIQQRVSSLDLTVDTNSQGTTLSFNLSGCPTLEGATLTGA